MLGSCIRRLSVVGLALNVLIEAPDALAAIGSTPGVPSVTSSGTAQYSIPLWTPPGIAGIRPQLSLVYSHQQPNGILGVGWSIGGLSSIRRCARTLAQDPGAAPVNVYDPSHQDRFCLDGNRLRWVSGNQYGVAPSTYRTELETFARITANSSLGTGPAWFKIEGKDGLFYEYGNSATSRQIPTGYTEAETWNLSKIADRNDNYLTITYSLENGSLRPDEITYTGTAALGAGSYVVKFVYEPAVRTDQIQEYEGTSSASGLVREVRRLLRIEMRHNGLVVRQYLFTYESGTGGLSRLKTVTECAVTPSDCFSPTNFDWHSGVSGFAATTVGGSTYPQSSANVYTVDLNADGREDILWYNGTAWRFALGQSNGQLGAVLNGPTVARQWSLPIEWDGDGRTDLLYAASNQFYALRSNGVGFDAAVATGVTYSASFDYWTADLDGDGLDDLVKLSTAVPTNPNGGKIWARLRRGSGLGAEALAYSNPETWFWGGFRTKDGYMTTHVRRPDFNGDARMDLLIQGCFGYDVEFGTCVLENGWFPFHSLVPATASAVSLGHINVGGFLINSAGATNLRPLLGDFNADGKTDLAYPGAQYWYMYESRGGGQTVIQGPSISGFTQSSARVADYDGDGYSDLFAYKTPGGLQVMRSNGKELETPMPAGLTGNGPILVADIAGDGLADFYSGTGSGYAAWNHNVGAAGSFPNLLKRATDGFGVFADFAYRPMTDSSVYTKYSGAAFPVIDEASSRQVVSQVTLTDGSGTGATYANTYTYEGARRHLQGRGFLGFAKRIVTDGSAGYNQRTEETYLQLFPYTGLPDSVILKQSSGTLIREIINSWSALSYASGYDSRFYPYAYSATQRLYELNGTYFANIWTTLPGAGGINGIDSTSGLIFDSTTTTTEVATGVNPGSSKSERIYHSAIFNDTGNWCLGRPDYSQSIKSHTLGGGGQKTRTLDPTWDGPTCRLTQRVIEPGDPSWAVTTTLGYDGFGNVDNQTVTGASMSPRTTTINWGAAGQFPESITQSVSATFSQTITQGFRYDLGLQTSLTDPNHLVTNELITSWEYDDFGRRTKETWPDGTDTTWSIVTCGTCESRVKYVLEQIQRTNEDVPIPIRTDRLYLDRFDRAVHAYSQLPGGGYSDRVVQFDARGRLVRQDVPFWGPAQPTGTTGDNGSLRFTYDQLDRATAEQLYTGVGALDRQTTHAHNGLAVTTTDPKTHQATKYITAWGDLTRVADAAGGSTNYQYEAFGLLSQVTDAHTNVVSSVSYNVRGMKTSMTDMDMGSWAFLPNALGEVEKVRDAKTIAPSWTTQTTFDHLGRPIKRIEAEGTTDFYFGTSAQAHNIGRLESVIGPGYSEILTYDPKTRLATRSITTDTTYQIDYGYHATTGFLETLTYPLSTAGYRFKLQYEYGYGMLSKVKRFDSPFTEYWKLNTLDARGNVLDETLGNIWTVVSGFDPLTGLIDYRRTGPAPAGGTSIQDLDYEWDLNANLTRREDKRQSLAEVFTYDALNRLLTATLNGDPTLAVDYDLIGNITTKDDVSAGNWTYHATKKHAVTATGGGPTYSYDANGNVSAKSGATISWYSFNLPNVINGSGVSSQFWYGPDRQRIKQVANFTSGSETTHYIGGIMEKVNAASNTHYRHYIAAPTGLVATYTRRVSAPLEDTFYFTHDPLGSIDSVTNQAGAVQVRLSYDAFGERRNEAGWSGTLPPADWTAIANTTRRGYSEHEMLDNLTLTHMNGRVHDQTIGRFVSADPFVQAPYYSQSLNRYAYVWNNPLTLIDPSGFAAGGPDHDDDDPEYEPPLVTPFHGWPNVGELHPRPNAPQTPRNDELVDGELSTVGGILADDLITSDEPDERLGRLLGEIRVSAVPNHGILITITGTLTFDRTVTKEQALEYMNEIHAAWNTAERYLGVRYAARTSLELAGRPGPFNRGTFHVTDCGSDCGPEVAAGKSIPLLGVLKRSGIELDGTEAHEFGHVLGLGHRTSVSLSIMNSYYDEPNRRVSGYDLYRLDQLYGR